MFGRCSLCLEKDNRINDLLDQVQMLRKVAFPGDAQAEPSLRDQEMDRIISGSHEPIEVTESEDTKEAMNILMGTYDSSQIDIV